MHTSEILAILSPAKITCLVRHLNITETTLDIPKYVFFITHCFSFIEVFTVFGNRIPEIGSLWISGYTCKQFCKITEILSNV